MHGRGGRTRRAWLALAAVLVLSAMVAAWLFAGGAPPGGDDAAGATSRAGPVAGNAAVASAAGVAQGASASPRQPAMPLPEGPFHATRAVLEARAEAGDAAAAHRLGDVLGRCRRYKPIADGVLTGMLARAAAEAVTLFGGVDMGDDATVDAMFAMKDAMDATCDGVGDLARDADPDLAQAWLARAAAAGHPRAMAQYGDHAFDTWTSNAELAANAAEVARRRDRARAWQDQAFAAGEVEVLASLSGAHGASGVRQPDPVRALAYLHAYVDAGGDYAMAGPLAGPSMAEPLDPGQREQARQLSKRILAALAAGGAAP